MYWNITKSNSEFPIKDTHEWHEIFNFSCHLAIFLQITYIINLKCGREVFHSLQWRMQRMWPTFLSSYFRKQHESKYMYILNIKRKSGEVLQYCYNTSDFMRIFSFKYNRIPCTIVFSYQLIIARYIYSVVDDVLSTGTSSSEYMLYVKYRGDDKLGKRLVDEK